MTEELLKPERKTCLLSPADPNYYADVGLAKVEKFSDYKQNMVKLLLELSSNPKGADTLSKFAIKFLKKREDQKSIVPSRLDYQ